MGYLKALCLLLGKKLRNWITTADERFREENGMGKKVVGRGMKCDIS